MPTVSIPNVRLAGISAAIPALEELAWSDLKLLPGQLAVAQRHQETPFRRMAKIPDTQADYCVEAAKPLLAELNWQPAEIDLIVLATLTPDYPIPATAIIIQDRLGVPKTAPAFDLPTGSLGFLHGLQLVASMLSNGSLKKALLLTGEIPKTAESPKLEPHRAIHGHNGTVAALEFSEGAPAMHFDAGGDGNDLKAYYMPVGGVRNPPKPEMFADAEGIAFASDFVLNATVLAERSQQELPGSIERVLAKAGVSIENIDACFLQPLSLPVEGKIRQKLGIPYEKFHGFQWEFGYAGSGSMPLAMLSRAAVPLRSGRQVSLFSGLGPGLAWGSAIIETEKIACPPILEI